MKLKQSKANTIIALFIAITGMILISSCGTTSSTTSPYDSYERGYQIGSGLRQIYDATR